MSAAITENDAQQTADTSGAQLRRPLTSDLDLQSTKSTNPQLPSSAAPRKIEVKMTAASSAGKEKAGKGGVP